jgi:murein DD-endopeptidase MepM/ murein hydrolase activator NlpD
MSKRRLRLLLVSSILLATLLVAVLVLAFRPRVETSRMTRIRTWFADPAAHPEWRIEGNTRCGAAPMLIPTTGFIGVGWGDGIRPLYQHTGYDIFSPDGADNVTPIYAAADGYLTRETTWRSAVIIRHPDLTVDGGEIWTYYTHMASTDGDTSYIDGDFPRGTYEQFVTAGTLLGYQGTWSGNPDNPTGLHLHFSVVQAVGSNGYANETEIANTYDPLPWLGLTETADGTIRCEA